MDDCTTLEERIRQTKISVALGRKEIARQRALVAILGRQDEDTTAKLQELNALEAQERTDIAELERLTVELSLRDEPHGRSRGLSKSSK